MRKGALAIVAASMMAHGTAEAHGRLPAVTRIAFAADGAVLARATFGLLVSQDGGAWDLVCPGAIGFGPSEDPVYAAGADGTLLATTAQGLAVSRDRACTWETVAGSDRTPFLDVTDDGRTALSSRYSGNDGAGSRYDSRLFRDGMPYGSPLDPSVVPHSVVVAGSRVDVAAVRFAGGAKAVLLSSLDGAATWSETAISLEPGETGLAAVAGDGDRVYLRTLANAGATRLLVHDAGGVRTIHRAASGLTGVALSPDHREIWAAAGAAGIQHATTSDLVFTRLAALDARCLAADARGLWACADDRTSGFVIGLSTDGGRTFAPRLRLCGIRGDVACAAGCTGEWAKERREIGCEEAAAPAAGPPSRASVTAAPPASAIGGDPHGGDASCAVGSASPRHAFGGLASLLLGLLAWARRVQSSDGRRDLRDDEARGSNGVRRRAFGDRR